MDLNRLANNTAIMIGSGRYARLPLSFDMAWAVPGGRFLVGSGGQASAMYDVRDGREIAEFARPVYDVAISKDPAAGVFLVAMGIGESQLRRISDGELISAPPSMGEYAFSPEPGALATVITYGTREISCHEHSARGGPEPR